jgi:transcription elongation factor Elf1
MEKKLICGISHKKVPCCHCGDKIWVHAKRPKALVTCTECQGKVTMRAEYRGERFDVHSRQYNGERIGNNE